MKGQTVIFDVSKKEGGNPSSNMKKIAKKYKQSYKIGLNKEAIDYERIKQANLFIIASPKDNFSNTEISSLKKYIETGGNLLLLLSEGGERRNNTNINLLLKDFGLTFNTDCVLRTSFYKYFHPKQAYIHNGVLNDQITRVINGYQKQGKVKNSALLMGGAASADDEDQQNNSKRTGIDFVYVNGGTLTVKQPANAILTSGPLTYPSNKPIGAVVQRKGKMLVFGSGEMFTDQYFEMEENQKLFDFFLKYFLTNEVEFEFPKEDRDREREDKFDAGYVPDIAKLADGLKSCFQESEDVPRDFTTLFDATLYNYDTHLIPQAVALFQQLSVKHQPLTLIVPSFETPLLGLAPAVFPPILRELSNPCLEEFDLDDEFAQEKVRLAQLTNKCENKDDLEYFVREAGDMLGISDKVKKRSEPKAIIRYLLEQIINYKKSNPN